MNRGGDARALGEILPAFLKKTGAVESVKKQKVDRAWRSTIGAEVENHAKVLKLTGTTLVVEVDSAARLMEMRAFSQQVYLKKINEILGTPMVTKIQYKFTLETRKKKNG